MNPASGSSGNVQWPIMSSRPAATPPQQRVTRVPLAPNNHHPYRRHQLPVLRPKPESDAVTPVSSLAQANARLIHARLRQNHDRLQVQLSAPPPPPSSQSTPTPNPITTFLSGVVRSYATRFNREVQHVHAVCTRLVMAEKAKISQERDAACAALARERDEARVEAEKLRVLLDRRKRSHSQLELADDEIDNMQLQYPTSPQSPPQRLLSPFVFAVGCSSRGRSPEDKTQFDLTVTCDKLSRPTKRRRIGDAKSETETNTAAAVSYPPETQLRSTHPPFNPDTGGGECDMDLETDTESDVESSSCCSSSASRAAISRGASRSQSQSPSTLSATVARLSPPFKAQVQAQPKYIAPTPSRTASQPFRRTPRLGIEHIDIMYCATQGKLVCRACVLTPTPSPSPELTSRRPPSRAPVHAFAIDAPWDVLRTHCETMHPGPCADVVGLDTDCLRELRRRLGLPSFSIPIQEVM